MNRLDRTLACVLALLATSGSAARTAAQAPRPGADDPAAEARPRAGVTGAVLDADTGQPIEGATVVLQPEVVGAFPAGPASGSAFTASSRSVITDGAGAYRFVGLPSGVYRVYVSRLGYRPYSITIELRGAVSPVAIALAAEPIPLQPVRSRGHARGTYESASAFHPNLDLARMLAAHEVPDDGRARTDARGCHRGGHARRA
jgi:hypothetical protein